MTLFILCCDRFEGHEITDCCLEKLKGKGRNSSCLSQFVVFVSIYRNKRFHIQNSNIESVKIKWLLSVRNHQNEIFLQMNWNIEPIRFIQTMIHSLKAIGGRCSKVTVNKEIRNIESNGRKQNSELKINIFELLEMKLRNDLIGLTESNLMIVWIYLI